MIREWLIQKIVWLLALGLLGGNLGIERGDLRRQLVNLANGLLNLRSKSRLLLSKIRCHGVELLRERLRRGDDHCLLGSAAGVRGQLRDVIEQCCELGIDCIAAGIDKGLGLLLRRKPARQKRGIAIGLVDGILDGIVGGPSLPVQPTRRFLAFP